MIPKPNDESIGHIFQSHLESSMQSHKPEDWEEDPEYT